MKKVKDPVYSAIVLNNFKKEKRTLSPWACKSSQAIRRDPSVEKVPDRENVRPAFFHDTDKIMHSRAYSRYIDKTQVFSLFENDHITHRVLHVQLVSKIGRVIGRCLRLNEDLVEAIALGHDLGHVPYGHSGEEALHELCIEKGIGCFCHNGQSTRILSELENKGKGLNLSLQVLDGILAHHGEMPQNGMEPNYGKDWNSFLDEYKRCFEVEGQSNYLRPMTMEGCVVRISDVIAYIGRDIEDAITVRLIKKQDLPKELRSALGSTNEKIINTLVMDLIKNSYEKKLITFSDVVFKALKDLLLFNRSSIYQNPKINTEMHKVRRMYRNLYDRYLSDITNSENSAITESLADMDDKYLQNTPKERIVVDFIAGMTDDFFNNQYNKLFVPQSYGYSL